MNTMAKFHPSLKKIFKEVDRWLAHENNAKSVERETQDINTHLNKTDLLRKGCSVSIYVIGHFYVNQACALLSRGEWIELAQSLSWGTAFRSLAFRFEAEGIATRESTRLPLAFSSSMKAIGPGILSHWLEAELGARSLIEVAEKNLKRYDDKDRKDTWGKNTTPAFLAALLCEAFGLKTVYYPVDALIPEYQALLDDWKTTDEALYQTVMHAAAEFHISRSKNSTSKINYEFDSFFDTIFPAELLAIQALRRRDSLPEFETGHLLIDTPWAVIRDLPEVEPHPLLAIVEARIKQDYPAIR